MKRIIVKRKGHYENYDQRKVYASIYAAALNAHYSDKGAETLSKRITNQINRWIKTHSKQLTAEKIRDQVVARLDDDEVTLMYKHHLNVC